MRSFFIQSVFALVAALVLHISLVNAANVVAIGEGEICQCALAVKFPTEVNDVAGTCGSDSNPSTVPPDPYWDGIRGKDILWVKTLCRKKPGAEGSASLPSDPWAEDITNSNSSSWPSTVEEIEGTPAGENWGQEAPSGDGDEPDAWSGTGDCPCKLYFKITWTDANGMDHTVTFSKNCFKKWHKI